MVQAMEHMDDGGIIIYKCISGSPVFLFLRRAEGWLDMPKGHIEKGETEMQASIRETFEETGIKVESMDPDFSYIDTYTFANGNSEIKKSVMFFMSKVNPAIEVKISKEHVGYEWLGYKEALEKIEFKDEAETIRIAYDYIINKKACR